MGKVISFNNNRIGRGKQKMDNRVRLAKYVLFFANNMNSNLYKTKLNKLLFYTQFLFYKRYGEALLENDFIKDYYGPVLGELDSYIEEFSEAKLIATKRTMYGTVIAPKVKLNAESYTERELAVLNEVCDYFDSYSSTRISDYSHREPLWKETELKDVIPIGEAYKLDDFN